jgi:hypothetical protein
MKTPTVLEIHTTIAFHSLFRYVVDAGSCGYSAKHTATVLRRKTRTSSIAFVLSFVLYMENLNERSGEAS